MAKPVDETPTFVSTPKGDELVILTRAHYDLLVAARVPVVAKVPLTTPSVGTYRDVRRQPVPMLAAPPVPLVVPEDELDVVTTRARRDEWISAGKPSAPLAVIRRVRAGDSWLKAFRSYRGITQAELAKKAGIGQGYLSEIETDRKTPSAEARSALAAALDIHPVFLSEKAPAIDLRADV